MKKKQELVQLSVFLSDLASAEEREESMKAKMAGKENENKRMKQGTISAEARKTWETGKALGLEIDGDEVSILNKFDDISGMKVDLIVEGTGVDYRCNQ